MFVPIMLLDDTVKHSAWQKLSNLSKYKLSLVHSFYNFEPEESQLKSSRYKKLCKEMIINFFKERFNILTRH